MTCTTIGCSACPEETCPAPEICCKQAGPASSRFQPARLLEFERPRAEFTFSYTINPVVFSSDGKGIVYPVRNGETDNLWLQNLDGSPGKQLTDFQSEFIRDFDYSFDGKQLAVIRGHRESDVVLIRESEK